jgi:hypothetical protein
MTKRLKSHNIPLLRRHVQESQSPSLYKNKRLIQNTLLVIPVDIKHKYTSLELFCVQKHIPQHYKPILCEKPVRLFLSV